MLGIPEEILIETTMDYTNFNVRNSNSDSLELILILGTTCDGAYYSLNQLNIQCSTQSFSTSHPSQKQLQSKEAKRLEPILWATVSSVQNCQLYRL